MVETPVNIGCASTKVLIDNNVISKDTMTQECWTLLVPKFKEGIDVILKTTDTPLSLPEGLLNQQIDRVRELVIDRAVMGYKYIIIELIWLYLLYYLTLDEDRYKIKDQIDDLIKFFRNYPRSYNTGKVTPLLENKGTFD